jgi:hypothetical protein
MSEGGIGETNHGNGVPGIALEAPEYHPRRHERAFRHPSSLFPTPYSLFPIP